MTVLSGDWQFVTKSSRTTQVGTIPAMAGTITAGFRTFFFKIKLVSDGGPATVG